MNTAYGASQQFTTLATVVPVAGMSSRCTSNSECPSNLCSTDAVDANNRRCVPNELTTADGGAMQFRYVPATGPGGYTQGAGFGATYTSVISQAYFVGRTEVTVGQWKVATAGTSPSTGLADNLPVENVDFWSVAAFANWMSTQAGLTPCYTFTPAHWDLTVSNWSDGNGTAAPAATDVSFSGVSCTGYRLPTESEWEWAARGPVGSGSLTSLYYWGASIDHAYLWFSGNSGFTPQPVATKLANAYGLHDMSGNVWEWVWDLYGAYPGSGTDYTGAVSGTNRIYRGGALGDVGVFLASGYRYSSPPSHLYFNTGFRLARTAPPPPPGVTTAAATDVASTSVQLNGVVDSLGSPAATDHGFCGGTVDTTPTAGEPDVICASLGVPVLGPYSLVYPDLAPGTMHYYRAYATNSAGTRYGATQSFTTAAAGTAPTVTTGTADSITSSRADLHGTITSLGTPSATAHGFCISSTDTTPTSGEAGVNCPPLPSAPSAGAFSAQFLDLSGGTTYYYSAFATNSIGTGYGAVSSFTTGPAPFLSLNFLNGGSTPSYNAGFGWTVGAYPTMNNFVNGYICFAMVEQPGQLLADLQSSSSFDCTISGTGTIAAQSYDLGSAGSGYVATGYTGSNEIIKYGPPAVAGYPYIAAVGMMVYHDGSFRKFLTQELTIPNPL